MSQNMADMKAKGRGNKPPMPGESNPLAKLTENQVRQIRQRRAAGDLRLTVARAYGITPQNVTHITQRHTWREVTP